MISQSQLTLDHKSYLCDIYNYSTEHSQLIRLADFNMNFRQTIDPAAIVFPNINICSR